MAMICICNTAEQISGIPASWPGYDLTIGASGQKVMQMQEQLDTIARVYTAIPRVSADGVFGEGTQASVRAFQKIFDLPQTGEVDFSTWYKNISDLRWHNKNSRRNPQRIKIKKHIHLPYFFQKIEKCKVDMLLFIMFYFIFFLHII